MIASTLSRPSCRAFAERPAVVGGESFRLLFQTGVVVQGAAADLGARNPDLAAVALQHAGGVQVRLREEGVGGAAGEQGHARRRLPSAGSTSGSRP